MPIGTARRVLPESGEADLDLCLNKIKSSFWGELGFNWTQIASTYVRCLSQCIVRYKGWTWNRLHWWICTHLTMHFNMANHWVQGFAESLTGQNFTHRWKYWFWHLLHSHDFHLSVWKKQHMILDCKCKLVQSCSNTSARISLEHTTLFKAAMNNAHSLLKMKHNVHP